MTTSALPALAEAIAIPKPPHAFKADANVGRLARIKYAFSLEREALGKKLHGYVERARELAERAREIRECM